MSNRQTKKSVQKQDALARKIWLAGLGAYAVGTKEISNLTDRSRTWLDDLIDQGREMEGETKGRWREASEQTTQAVTDRVNSKVQQVTGLDPNQLDELDAKLDKLADTMDKLAAAKAKPAAVAVPAAKPEAKPAAARRTTKAAAKKDS